MDSFKIIQRLAFLYILIIQLGFSNCLLSQVDTNYLWFQQDPIKNEPSIIYIPIKPEPLKLKPIETMTPNTVESKFRKFYHNFKYCYNNEGQSIWNLDIIIDTLIKRVSSNKITKNLFLNEAFWNHYKINLQFRKIIDRIDALPNDTINQASKLLENDINRLQDKEIKIYSLLYFGSHFLNSIDYRSILYNYYDKAYNIIHIKEEQNHEIYGKLNFFLDTIQKKIPDNIKKKYLEILGDFCANHDLLEEGLLAYSNVQILTNDTLFSEKGRIEEKIAYIFTGMPDIPAYIRKAIFHYNYATNLYQSAHETNKAFRASLKSIHGECLLLNFYNNINIDSSLNILNKGLYEISQRKSLLKADYYLFYSLGVLFSGDQFQVDLNISLYFFKMAVITSLLYIEDYGDFQELTRALNQVAISYALIGNELKAITYIDIPIILADKQDYSREMALYIFEKANIYRIIRNYQEALSFINKGFQISKRNSIYSNRGNDVAAFVFEDLFSTTNLEKYRDSSDLYLGRYYRNNSFTTEEIDNLHIIDYNYDISRYEEERDYLYYLNDSLNYINESLKIINDLKKDSIHKKQEEIRKLKSEYDSMDSLNSSTRRNNDILKATNDSINIQVEKKNKLLADKNDEYDNLQLSNYILWTLAILGGLSISIAIVMNIRLKSKKNILNMELNSKNIQIGGYNNEIKIIEKDKNRLISEKSDLTTDIERLKVTEIKLNKNIEIKNSEIIKSNTRAAISQLFARTDSHDLGHVLDAYKSIEDFGFDEFKEGQYLAKGDITKNEGTIDKTTTSKIRTDRLKTKFAVHILNENGETNPTVDFSIYPNLIGYFNQYLKTRMDFRADVAIGDPNSLTALDFYNDVFIPFNNNLIFNNRISGISDDGLKYKIENTTIVNGNIRENKDVKIPVAIPNDVLGCHALYIIWSNVIRNSVKHGMLSDPEKIELKLYNHIEEYTPNKDFYEVSLYTNIYRKDEDMDELVVKRNEAFDKKIFKDADPEFPQEPRGLRDNNLGSIEMAACAAYLRKLNVTEIEEPKYDLFSADKKFKMGAPVLEENGTLSPMIMYAYAHKDEGHVGESSLGYKFYLLKPKEILVICDNPEELSNLSLIKKEDKPSLSSKGVNFIKPDEINKNTFNHKFLVFIGNKEKLNQFNFTNKLNVAGLPKRRINLDKNIQFNTLEELMSECWKSWVSIDQINIYDLEIDTFDKRLMYPAKEIQNGNKIFLYNHYKELEPGEFTKDIYREMICGHHWLYGKKNEIRSRNPKVIYPYIESFKTKVLIIDERIQKNIVLNKKKYADTIPFDKYFYQLGIIIPGTKENEPNLNEANLKKNIQSLKLYIKKWIDEVDFVVIHLGILEKLLDKNAEKNTQNIDFILNKLINGKDNRSKIVITTGRGKAVNVNTDISFVPISPLQNAIETNFDKFRLVQILYNSRKSI